MKYIYLSILCLLFPAFVYASNSLTFPMTIYGTVKDTSNTSLGAGAKISFYNSGVKVGEFTTSEAGKFGYNNSLSGLSPTFSIFSGGLEVKASYQSIEYSLASFSGSGLGCSSSGTIFFVEGVCNLNLTLIRTTPVASPSGGGDLGGGGGGSISIPPSSVNTPQTPVNIATPESTTSQETISKSIISTDLRRGKVQILQTDLPKGTILTVYRVLSNGRQIRAGTVKVLNTGKIRIFAKVKGTYIVR